VDGGVRLLHGFPNFTAEMELIAKDIRTRLGEHPHSVAILARRRRLLEEGRNILTREGLSASIAQRKDEFQSAPLVWLHSMLRLANDRQSLQVLEAVAGSFTQLTGIHADPLQVSAEAKAGAGDFLREWTRAVSRQAPEEGVEWIIRQIEENLIETIDVGRFATSAMEWLDKAVVRTRAESGDDEGFAGYEEEAEAWRTLTADIQKTYRRQFTLEAFLQEMQMRSKEANCPPGTIDLMTIHSAKGKEFSHVYLVGMVDDEIPSFQSLRKGDNSFELEEERRSCFVAITRTLQTLTLSFAETYHGWPKRPSRFLKEMELLR
jgi:DNA helicase-2/ATP-dependent DNA helicase PcrA